MPGMLITDRQVRRYMEQRRLGATQVVAAAKAGFSERTARRLDGNPVLPGQRAGSRRKRTRADPFAGVWAEEIVPLLRAVPHLRGTTVLETLQRRHPGRFADGVLRSLQRRIAHWRATEGPDRELIFRQEHPPGEQALSDFTDASSLAVTIDGAPFPHLLYHFWLAFSGWQSVKAIQGGESFTALTEGLQEALWQLGAVPLTHRTDRLSAAYRNLHNEDDAAAGYRAFCDHYGLQPTRNNPGVSHENGSVEAAHGHLKTGLREALELRGSRDFADVAVYQAFLAEFVRVKNARRRPALQLELQAMRPLPRFRTTDFSLATVTVTRSGTISIRGVLYTVPSRLVGCRLKVHIYDDRLSLTASQVFVGGDVCAEGGAARTARQQFGEGDGEAALHRRDRVRHVAFGPDRRRLWVGNRRVWQISGASGRRQVLRGESSPVRRSGIRRRRCTRSRDDGSHASLVPRSGRGRAPA